MTKDKSLCHGWKKQEHRLQNSLEVLLQDLGDALSLQPETISTLYVCANERFG